MDDATDRIPPAADPTADPAAAGVVAQPSSLPPGPLQRLRDGLATVVRGQDDALDMVIVVLLCRGHGLLEGVPGTAKTLTVRALSSLIGTGFGRIQFTPDLMPADIVGTNVYRLDTHAFELRRGPIFTDLLLADEINRAPAKTQSALLEAMAERQVTIDGQRLDLSDNFTVFATQNPVELEGTYPLPEAQQDRFLLKIRVDYPPLDAEREVVRAAHAGRPLDSAANMPTGPVLSIAELEEQRRALVGVRVDEGIESYILEIVRATRTDESLVLGAGTRGALGLLRASKARALLRGRDFVTPDDVVAMVEPVLAHRVLLSAEAQVSGERERDVLAAILDRIDVPR